VREVQRADNLPPSRIAEPLLIEPRRNYNWFAIGGVVVLLAIIAFTYSAISRHHQDAPASSNSSASQSP
jgi:hypothetical protein